MVKFNILMNRHGTIQQSSCIVTPQTNGVTERKTST